MEVEADLFLVFTGFNASTTAVMSLGELMGWHRIAIGRNQKALEEAQNAG